MTRDTDFVAVWVLVSRRWAVRWIKVGIFPR